MVEPLYISVFRFGFGGDFGGVGYFITPYLVHRSCLDSSVIHRHPHGIRL